MKIYVEGGGACNKALSVQCRQGFSKFFARAGLQGRMPSVVACGGRNEAYKRFRAAPRRGGIAVLLVDSEAPVNQPDPWDHVREHDKWRRPTAVSADHLHLMVQSMEAWLHADREALQEFFGKGFRPEDLAHQTRLEAISTRELVGRLEKATRDCQPGRYSKGEHSFRLLALIEPAKVRAASPHADRLLCALDRLSGE